MWSIGTISAYVQLRHSSGAPAYASPLGFLITFELLDDLAPFFLLKKKKQTKQPNKLKQIHSRPLETEAFFVTLPKKIKYLYKACFALAARKLF